MWGCLLLGLISISLILWNSGKKVAFKKVQNRYELLEKRRFLKVSSDDGQSDRWSNHFDLKNNYFFSLDTAVFDNKTYGFNSNKKTDKIVAELASNDLSIFKGLDLSNAEIQQSDYVIEKDILPLLDKSKFKKEHPSNFEARYLNDGLEKVRITFNKQFLPVTVDGYFDDGKEQRWQLLRKISYPYKNRAAFNRELKISLARLKRIERTESEAGNFIIK